MTESQDTLEQIAKELKRIADRLGVLTDISDSLDVLSDDMNFENPLKWIATAATKLSDIQDPENPLVSISDEIEDLNMPAGDDVRDQVFDMLIAAIKADHINAAKTIWLHYPRGGGQDR